MSTAVLVAAVAGLAGNGALAYAGDERPTPARATDVTTEASTEPSAESSAEASSRTARHTAKAGQRKHQDQNASETRVPKPGKKKAVTMPGKPARAAAPAPADPLGRWISRAIAIMRSHGVTVSAAYRDEIRTIIDRESSGNPRAINRWDSNAARGTPSKGLMQTIDPTFDAYKLPGHDDIYHPVDNIIAGVRYTLARYGGFANHPGLASMAAGGGYQGY
ncbi:transglycosylase SLT domain-containing protein [Prauserella muralis]|uniref:transglycosylase SLT domain-containing protein n=1 Tax=Prauserella muralis TaxID=588067 RepID=UPI001FEC5AD9|nr:transglycosylase SLT domain-containing protein [Prauserella muralis]